MKKINCFVTVIFFLFLCIRHAGAEVSFKKKIYLKSYTPRNVAIKSAIFPGWGQYANRQYAKAYTVSALEITALTAAFTMHYLAEEKHDEYKDKGMRDDSLYDDYATYYRGSVMAGGIALGVWIYSITEAYLFTRDEIKRRNENVWHIDFDKRRIVLAYKKKF